MDFVHPQYPDMYLGVSPKLESLFLDWGSQQDTNLKPKELDHALAGDGLQEHGYPFVRFGEKWMSSTGSDWFHEPSKGRRIVQNEAYVQKRCWHEF